VDEPRKIKNIVWIGSSRRDLKAFPSEVKDMIVYVLYQARVGRKAPSAKQLVGFGGVSVL
jgi:phage-related protein